MEKDEDNLNNDEQTMPTQPSTSLHIGIAMTVEARNREPVSQKETSRINEMQLGKREEQVDVPAHQMENVNISNDRGFR